MVLIRRLLLLALPAAMSCKTGSEPIPATVREITVSATVTSLVVGNTTQLTAHVVSNEGDVVHGAPITWGTLTPGIVGVSAAGVVTALSPGTGKVRGSYGGRSGDLDLTVTNPPVASVTFDRDSLVLTLPSSSVTLSPMAKDAKGKAISNPTYFFASDAPKVATINQLGLVTAVAAGTAVVSASTEGITASVRVRVTANVTSTSPRIATVTALAAGGTAVVTGSNFSSTVNGNTVLVEGVPATVTSASATQLSLTLPPTGWACEFERSVSLQVTANGESGVATATLRTASPRALTVGQSLILSSGSDARCNELSATGGTYLVTVYNAARALANNDATFALRGAGRSSVQQSAVIPLPSAVGRLPSVDLPSAVSRLPSDYLPSSVFRLPSGIVPLQRSLDFARAQGSPLPALRRLRASTEDAESVTARANQISTAGAITQVKLPNLDAPSFCNGNIPIGVRTAWVGQKAIIVEDTTSVFNGSPTLKGQLDSLYARVGQEFDSVMWPILTTNFGNPLAMDGQLSRTGKVVMVFSPRINTMLSGSLLGFVVSCDFYPVSQAASSNVGEYFYAIMPTSLAAGIGKGTRDSWLRDMRGTIVHEVKHITAFGERFARNAAFEDLWLEEGLARHAEEQLARVVHGFTWKSNAGYQQALYCEVRPASTTAPQCAGRPILMLRHFDALYQYLQSPEAFAILGRVFPSDATFYGTSWSVVRWMMDQYATSEATFMSGLVQSTRSGVANLESRISGHLWEEMLGEWALAQYTDDYPGVTFANSRLQFPSWNLRDQYLGLCTDLGGCGTSGSLSTIYPVAYPFVPRRTSFGAFSTNVNGLPAGSFTSWLLEGTQAGTQLLDLRGSSVGEPPSQLRLAIVRIK